MCIVAYHAVCEICRVAADTGDPTRSAPSPSCTTANSSHFSSHGKRAAPASFASYLLSQQRIEPSKGADGAAIRLCVVDDGVGIQPGVNELGLGLVGMKERLAALNGSLEITSEPGQGTTLEVVVLISGPAPSPNEPKMTATGAARTARFAKISCQPRACLS